MFDKLVEKARQGDKLALEEVIKRLQPLLVSSIRRYYNKANEYEDLMQEGNLKIIESIRDFDKEKGVPFLGYIKSNIKFLYLNKHKERIHISLNQPLGEEGVEMMDLLVSQDMDNLDRIIREEDREDLNKALSILTERQKQVLLLYYLGGFNIDRIALSLGIAYRTVVNTKTRALDRLKTYYGL